MQSHLSLVTILGGERMERPVWEMLREQRGRMSLHMPGHKGKAPFGEMELYGLDTTELPGTDDLYAPESGLKRAEELYARASGSAETLLLHNGSTAGNQAMLMLYAGAGDTVLLPRNAHVSATNACVVGDLRPVFMPLSFTEDGYGYIAEQTVLDALDRHPEAKCLLLTRPDFYGCCLPLEKIVRKAHAQGCRVVVDEAHGAHFPWMQDAQSAGALGVDAWVQSSHKTLPSLTGTAVLHLRHAEDRRRAMTLLRLTQTSSPNFVLMMSIDDARAWMEGQGRERLLRVANAVDALRERLFAMGYRDAHAGWRGTGMTFDRTRLVIDAPQGGDALDAALREKGIDVEMHDLRRVVCILTAMDDAETVERLGKALAEIPAEKAVIPLPPYQQPLPERAMPPRQAVMGASVYVPLHQAAGRVAAAAAGLYPPGIPLTAPGEIFTEETTRTLARAGVRGRFGVEGECVLCVK